MILCLLAVSSSSLVNIVVEPRVINTVSSKFRSFNIDTTDDREFFRLDLTNPELIYLAQSLSPAYLRVGGTGGDYLHYEFGQTTCDDLQPPQTCLNQTHWKALTTFAREARLDLVFGLNIMQRTKTTNKWDPSNTRELISYILTRGEQIAGFELGNEKNEDLTPRQTAADFATLYALLVEMYPAGKVPKIIGPDPHSFKEGGPDSKIQWIGEFLDEIRALKVPLYATTHHEYIEVDQSNTLNATYLNIATAVAVAMNETVKKHFSQAKVWAGEIGPHNGGTPPCDHTSLRWANFANGFWYLDNMGTKAVHGYDAFCRQDLIGADYGLLDCQDHTPLPDYYSAFIYGRVMGTRVLAVKVDGGNANIRGYAHCSHEYAGGVTVMLLNLGSYDTNITTNLAGSHEDYQLTAVTSGSSSGLWGQKIALNGKELIYKKGGGVLPNITARKISTSTFLLPKQSYGFYVFPSAKLSVCP